MNKSLIYSMLAATMLFATSCQQDEVFVDGNEAVVQFQITTPEMATRAYSDGMTATNLQYAVYDKDGKQITEMFPGVGHGEKEIKGSTTVELKLAQGNTYHVLFWAAADGAPYNVDFVNHKLNVLNYTSASNDESRDAFYKWHEVTVNSNEPQKVELRRPFAQLNIGTGDMDDATAAGVTVATTSVTVSNVYTAMDFADGGVDEATKTTATFSLAPVPAADEKFPVENYKYLAMNYVLVPADKVVVDKVELTYTGAAAAETRTFTSIPLQRNYRTNIYGDLLTKGVDFIVEIVPTYYNDDPANMNGDTLAVVVNTKEELEKAVKQDAKVIRILLDSDVELNASDAYLKLGGASTDSIIIDGTGVTRSDFRKLTLATTYWSRLNTVNPEAVIILRNLNLTSSQESGTWNSYDVTFQCNVKLENVTLDKALALDNAGKTATLKNVTINETHDYYAMWISAAGQTVDIDGLTINSGRGIKIDEQYVNEAVAKVTLNVKDATFTTAKKAAILVKSAKGADITLENVDIENVAADKVNAVWVDEDAAAYFDLVNVVGGTKILEGAITIEGKEGTYKTVAAALAVATPGDVIVIPAGEFALPKSVTTSTPGAITFKGYGSASILKFGNDGTASDGGLNGYADNMELTFEDLTVVSPAYTSYSGGFGRAKSVTFNNCAYKGQYRSHSALAFNNCTIDPENSYIYTDYANADFVNCTFNASKGKAIQVYNDGNTTETTINVTNCTFTAAEVGYTWDKKPVTAIDINSNGEKFTVNINNTTATGFGIGLYSRCNLWNIKGGAEYVTVNIDGSKASINVATADQLVEALENGENVVLTDDVKIDPAGMSNAYGTTGINVKNGQTIDGGGHILDIKGAGGTWDSGISTTGGLIKNITITGSFRGIFVNHNSTHSETVVLDNVIIDGTTYTISCDQGLYQGLEATNSTFNGWTSYAATLGNAKFTNCSFGEGNGYAFCRPYAPTEFVGCDFEADYTIDPRAAVTFENCTFGGVALTAENLATLVTNTANATVK
ncbi:MAG: hypothetical protein E7084_06995 [Bacteroidales bacterium]|nr:hypothetical protein [Bacteroidales bacterium]